MSKFIIDAEKSKSHATKEQKSDNKLHSIGSVFQKKLF